MTTKEQLYQMKLDENAWLISNRQILADIHKKQGNLIAEKQVRAEIKELQKKRDELLAAKVTVEEQEVETVWK